ncbi:MAG: HWE histidine kinase domain-containing protein [Steroidobacter sp.]
MAAADTTDTFLGHSRAAETLRRLDWSKNPLGPIPNWSRSLRTMTGAMLESAFPQCIVWGSQQIMIHNDAFLPILGRKPSAQGRSFPDVWPEAWSTVAPLAKRAYAGEATFIEDFALCVERSGHPEQTYFTFCYSPIRDDDGQVAGFLDTVIETTAKVRAERHARLINNELAHRIQNMLTIVNCIADQTFRNASSVADARSMLSRRIKALGRAHDVLTETEWNEAPIGSIVEGALAPHIGALGEICAQGPPLTLHARQALTLSMCLHELATNSMKYGALSRAGGEVTLRWSIEPGDEGENFRLTWVESNGPTVIPPERRGFGSLLIENVLADDFLGKVDVDYHPQGLRCQLITKLANLRA